MDNGLFPKYANAALKNLHKKTPEDLRALLEKIVKTSKRTFFKEANNLYLYGIGRVGKSYVLHAIANHIIKSYEEKSVYIVTASDLLTYFIERTWNPEYNYSWIDVLLGKRVLIVDGLGKEYRGSQSGFFEIKFEAFIRERINNSRITYIESKYDIGDLELEYGKGFAGIINGEFVVFDVDFNVDMSKVIKDEKLRIVKC
jgi:DNA replication protein DnaC